MQHEGPVDGVDAVGIIAVEDAEQVVEKLDVPLDDLLTAKDPVGDTLLDELIQKGGKILEIVTEDGRVIEVADTLDDTHNALGLLGDFIVRFQANGSCCASNAAERGILAVYEVERVYIIAHGLGAAVGAGEVLLGVVAMPLKEPIKILIGAAIKPEDVLAGITHEEDLHVGIDLDEQVEYPVVEFSEVLRFVDDKNGHLSLEPFHEGGIRQFAYEVRQDVVDGDDIVFSLHLRNEIPELRVGGQ